ncbi:hypothetical protein [Oryza sativa Japonica Group]|uniref:Uncharacterized protein n=2 Tax=Oryza sativa subsp. japonica TaxID=39947 RepID=Q5VQY0_ORYSJ|nr:hypothetical protein [Oryza sativa Japonica Group]BAD68150.1 hypothetical protein [Oryza sativa Japonica Group]
MSSDGEELQGERGGGGGEVAAACSSSRPWARSAWAVGELWVAGSSSSPRSPAATLLRLHADVRAVHSSAATRLRVTPRTSPDRI